MGKGEGKNFTTLEWVQRQFQDKLGFSPFPGTLNLRLNHEDTTLLKSLRNARSIDIEPANPNFCVGRCYKVLVGGTLKGAIVIPEVPNYYPDIVEIVAPVKISEELRLKAGDAVKVDVMID